MRKKMLIAMTVLTLVLTGLVPPMSVQDGDARSRFKSRSFSSKKVFRSSGPSRSVWGTRSGGGIFGSSKPAKSSSSSSGYSKPGSTKTGSGYKKPGAGTAKPTKKSAGYAKPGAKKTGFTGAASSRTQVKSMRKSKAARSFKAYKTEQSRFAGKSAAPSGKDYKSSPVLNKSKRYGRFDYSDHYARRDGYYGSRGWNAPSYAYMSRPSFGMWDAMFLWMILDNVGNRNYAAAAYNHADDPGFQEWRQEAERLAADNVELKEQLNSLDKEVASMSGPRDPGYIPEGMDPEVALAAEVLAEKPAEDAPMRLATASSTGNYHYFGTRVAEYGEGLDIILRNTAGSMENLELLLAGKVDAALVQSDAFMVFRKRFPESKLVSEQTELYPEAVQMIANRDSGITSVSDLDPDRHVLCIGPEGSGTAMTWEGFCTEDDWYRSIRTRNMDYGAALEEVQRNPDMVMMFVSGLHSSLLERAEKMAEKSGDLRLVAVDDWDFNDTRDEFGNRVYSFIDIPSGAYPELQKGFLFSSDVETLAVNSVLVVRTDWVETYGPEAMDSFSFAVLEAKPDVLERIRGE